MKFWCYFYDEGNCEINPHPQEITASDLGHAMQKAAAVIPEEAIEVRIFINKKGK